MESTIINKQYISPAQIIATLVLVRLSYSTAYVSHLFAGNSICDVLPSIIVSYIVNFLIAIPILLMLRKRPDCNIVQYARNVFGKTVGIIIGVIYYLAFIYFAITIIGAFNISYSQTITTEANNLILDIMLLIVCVYGALKGMEAIVRFGTMTLMYYCLIILIIMLPLISQIKLDYTKPVFYNGLTIFAKSMFYNYNSTMEIVLLAFMFPFLKKNKRNPVKTYAIFNTISMAGVFILMFMIVTVMGAFGSMQYFPIQTLANVSRLGKIKHLDTLDMSSFILNVILSAVVYIYMATLCLWHSVQDKKRDIIVVITSVIVVVVTWIIFNMPQPVGDFIAFTGISIIVTIAVLVIPIIILVADVIKERLKQNDENQG